MDTHAAGHTSPPPPDSREFVTITINGTPQRIHRGRHQVSELKKLGGVPLADVLNQVVKGKLLPLPDDGAITVKEDEVFVSHPRDCQSS